jgi:hypothetical protein
MTREQRKKYEWFRNLDWEFDEEFPSAGIIILRKNSSSISDFTSWRYVTINKAGLVKEGRHEP